MHEFFMYLCDELKIDTFVIGDEKQSIYIWRGAQPELFESILGKKNFLNINMQDNFRSCQQIQNYSNLLCKETRKLYSPIRDLSSVIILRTTQQNWVSSTLQSIDSDKKCALLRFSNESANLCAQAMTNAGGAFTYILQPPIASITTKSAWLYNAVANYFIVPTYSAYDFRNEVPNEIVGNKQLINYIKQALVKLDECIKEKSFDKFEKQIYIMAQDFGYTTNQDHCLKLYTTITDTKYHPAFNVDSLQRIAMTFHSSKGLEFEQVILFVSDYQLSNNQQVYNHYVAVTRAKSKLVMVCINDDENAKKYFVNISKIMNESNLKIDDVVTIKYC